jgi:Cu-processing system permease protein
MSAVAALAGWELRTAVRSRWVLAMSVVFTVACLAVTLFGLRTLRELGLAGASAASDGLLNLGVLFPPLIGLLIGAGSIASARERRTLAMVASQPMRPAAVLAGWFLGLTAAMWLTVAVAFGAAGVAVGSVAQGSDLPGFLTVVAVTLAVTAVSVSIGIAISSLASNRMQALAVVVAVWFALAIGMDLLMIVVVPGLELGPFAMLVAVLANPLEAGRLLAVLVIEPSATALGPFGAYLIDRFGATGSKVILAGSLVGWTVLGLAVSHTALRHRDV